MLPRQVIELPQAVVEVEIRSGYLFVVESGQLSSLADVTRYCESMDRIVLESKIHMAIIDARAELGDPPESVREAMWRWLSAADRGFSVTAFVLPTEIAVARVNMTALVKGAKLRAFTNVHDAQRWLLRRPRFATRPTMAAQEAQPSAPDLREPAESSTHRRLRPGEYKSTEERIDHVGVPKKKKRRSGGSQVA